jgi:class 3 adenylate cyclase
MQEERVEFMKTLLEFVTSRVRSAATFGDSAFIAPGRFPLVGVETFGAVLFADLPGFSRMTAEVGPVQCTYAVNHFFTWFEGETEAYGGIIDKFIGDEVMVVFLSALCKGDPARIAFAAAHRMLENDPFEFAPRMGIASGRLFIGLVGTGKTLSTTAIGTPVNTAARLLSGLKKAQGTTNRPAICVGAEFEQYVRSVVDPNSWSVGLPRSYDAKNMGAFDVIDVTRNTTSIMTGFDYWADARDAELFARANGAVVTEPIPRA